MKTESENNDQANTESAVAESRPEKRSFFKTRGGAATAGALLGIPMLFVLTAICALSVGIPVPLRGWDSGVEVAFKSPMVVIFYSIVSGFLPFIVAVGAGALTGLTVWNYRSRRAEGKASVVVGSMIWKAIGVLVCLSFALLLLSAIRSYQHAKSYQEKRELVAQNAIGKAAQDPGESRMFENIEFVWIPLGTFEMGSPVSEEGRGNSERQHEVTLTRGFWMGKYEITQAQWKAMMGTSVLEQVAKMRTPTREGLEKASKDGSDLRGEGGDFPMYFVSWNDCIEFINTLNTRGEGKFRLPTEAEWEYACRAGTTTPFYFGETISTDQANFDGAWSYGTGQKGVTRGHSMPVGSFPANDWGLYDMHGNMREWCQDWHGKYLGNLWHTLQYGAALPAADPQGPTRGSLRVVRSGTWAANYGPSHCRSAARHAVHPDIRRRRDIGFRLCRDE